MTTKQETIYDDWKRTGDSLIEIGQRHNVDKACVSRSIDKGLAQEKIIKNKKLITNGEQ